MLSTINRCIQSKFGWIWSSELSTSNKISFKSVKNWIFGGPQNRSNLWHPESSFFFNFQNRSTFTTQTADFKFVRNVLTNMLAFSKIGWDDIFFLSVIEYPNYTFQYDQGWVIKKSLLWELQGGDMKYLLSRICLLIE